MPKPTKFNKYGWRRDKPDWRDLRYMPPKRIDKPLPLQVDLRHSCPPVYDQGQLGSCTANALAGNIEFDLIIQKSHVFQPSRLFIYYNERLLEGTINEDSGAELRDGIKSLNRWGACHEEHWPYDISKFTRKPNQFCYRQGAQHKIAQYERINQDLDHLRSCLADGHPFVFGFAVYESFESDTVAKNGIVPMPLRTEKQLGGHAVMAIGYDDEKKWFIVRNSWGTNWGDRGYFYFPYDYMLNGDLSADFWSIKLVP